MSLFRFASSFILASLLFAGARGHGQSLLTNGDFETINPGAEPIQTFPGWTENKSAGGVPATTPLSGNHSLKLLGAETVTISQSVVALTDPFVFSLSFAMNDPGTARGLNLFLVGSTATGSTQINLRVVENTGAASLGEVQVFDGTAFQTILTDIVSLSSDLNNTPLTNTLSISGQFNGASSSYVVTVNGSSSTSQTRFQTGTPTSLTSVQLLTANGAAGADWVADNVSLVPEPSTLLLMAGGIGLLGQRRRRKA